MSGQLDKAEGLLRRAVALGPDDVQSLCDLCEVLMVGGRRQEALAIGESLLLPRLDAELHRHPDNAEAASILAALSVELGKVEQAESWARRAIAMEPDAFNARYNVACVFACLGKPDLALESLHYIVSRMPRLRPWLLGQIQTDSQIARLRGDPAFDALVAGLQADSPAG